MVEHEKERSKSESESSVGEQPTKYDVWQRADGLHRGEASSKRISFRGGFVRVRKNDWVTIVDEGWATDEEKSFVVPPWHSCEVLGNPLIKFTKS
ncbi:hypothetical protein PMIN01_08123 [Paraphaeosphaeria minitans]|uniref:Uncharacterized protein n=1 Tax=Paraphaeosphaeria minitans TaxID=565426 RepID=A0A9P6KP95_9PLEO|nr:hypothetical protein PMIN01_08123 [Paraphaeosphaeria minitans]